jgi:hypothetical protein
MTMSEGVDALTGLSQFDTFHDTGTPWVWIDKSGARGRSHTARPIT